MSEHGTMDPEFPAAPPSNPQPHASSGSTLLPPPQDELGADDMLLGLCPLPPADRVSFEDIMRAPPRLPTGCGETVKTSAPTPAVSDSIAPMAMSEQAESERPSLLPKVRPARRRRRDIFAALAGAVVTIAVVAQPGFANPKLAAAAQLSLGFPDVMIIDQTGEIPVVWVYDLPQDVIEIPTVEISSLPIARD